MAEATPYASTIEVKNPLVPFGIAKALVGVVAVLVAAVRLARVPHLIQSALETHSSDGESLFAAGVVVSAIASIVWLIWGLKACLTGSRRLAHIIVPPGAPKVLENLDELRGAMINRYMPAYVVAPHEALSLARKYISGRVPFLTLPARAVVKEDVRFVGRIVGFVGALAIGALVVNSIPAKYLSELRVYLAELRLPENITGLVISFAIVLAVAAAMKFVLLFALLPAAGPKSEVLESIRTVQGGGDPSILAPDIEKALLSIRLRDFPNRPRRTGFQPITGGVEDTGKVSGELFLETQPQDAPHRRPIVTWFYLAAAIAFLILGLVITTKVPEGLAQAYDAAVLGTALAYVGSLAVGITYANTGKGFLNHALYLLNSFRFESTLVYVWVEGTFGRTEVKAGRAITDSFETSNIVVRSDSHVRTYTSRLLTETDALEDSSREEPALMGRRSVVGMSADSEAQRALRLAEECVERFEKAGVVLRAIDVGAGSVQEIAQTNIAYHQAKQIAASQAPERMAITGKVGEEERMLLEGDTDAPGPVDSSADTKICPDCAETVKAKARKCRFCGYVFEDQP